ncbi:MAG TPA: hypothetical protein DCZ92_04605 [Elusimicrobia bacterium]|nr:MAG: hypothetical protein A2016_03980 [Elusimicrobia bacterium GWF2_62_30]HBA60089.1 hypothetical protein [Elusimicrobiota bacterium]
MALALAAPVLCRAGAEDTALTRDESAAFKKALVAVLGAMGLPPQGFVKEKDDFNLPTDFYTEGGKLRAVTASVHRRLAIKGVKDAEAGNKKHGADYKKKILEAQSKGDYQEVMRLSQEMQKDVSSTALSGAKAEEEKKLPIRVSVEINDSQYQAIDPDLVVFEKPGVLALKMPQDEEGDPKGSVAVYFQPSALKDTKKLSKVQIDVKTVPVKTSIVAIAIKLEGPVEEVETWAKRIDTKTVLAQINAALK